MSRRALALLLVVVGCGDDGPAMETETTTATASTTNAGTSPTTDASTTADPTAPTTADSTGSPEVGWEVIAELGPELGMVMSVWGPSASEVRVAGGQRDGDGSTGFVLLRTGDAWDPETLPSGTPMLNWVGQAGADTWTVGLQGTALRLEDGAWIAHETPTDVTLWGVWGSAPDDVWAVGGDGVAEAPTLLRFDGTSWTLETLPAIPPDSHALFKVWGANADDVFIAGDHGVLMRRVADAWEVTELRSIAPMIAVWGLSPTEVVAVGGRSNARIARWGVDSWQDVTLEEPGLNGVWLASDGTATLVGRLGVIFELLPDSLVPVQAPPPTNLLLHAVHGFEDGSRIAVGGSFEGPPPWVGVIVEHPG